MQNYYHILGLKEDANPAEIKAAFKKLAVQFHPDKHSGREDMEEKFKEINHAHQILSDPYEKARYDLKLKYQRFSTVQSGQQRSYRHHQSRHSAPRYTTSKAARKQDTIATIYAFGITFLIAAAVMGGVWAKQSYDDYERQKVLDARRAIFETAKYAFKNGDYIDAYSLMSELRFFKREEADMKAFKNSMVDVIIRKGDHELRSGDYGEAIKLYDHVFELKPNLPWYSVKKNQAQAYKMSGQIDKSIQILEEFLVNEYDIIESLVELAEINRDYLNKPEVAMEKFQLAHRLTVKRYKRFYGEAYPILISQEYLPTSHYYLYTGLADMYLQLDDPEMAIKASNWNKYIWPDSVDAYITSAEAFFELGNLPKACSEYSGAHNRGWTGHTITNCN